MKKNLFLVAILMLCQLVYGQQKSPVGVQLYSFRNEFARDVRGTMQKVKDMGITDVEVAGFYGLSITDYKKLLEEFGIKAIGIGADFSELDNEEKLKEIIKNAKVLGAKNVVTYWIPHKGNEFGIEDIAKAAKVFNKAGKVLKENGLAFLYHAHGYEFRPYKLHYLMDELLQSTNPLYVNYEMDIYWVYHPGHNPALWLKNYPTRWKALHIKDRQKGTVGNQNGNSDPENDVTVGTGDLNMRDILLQAKKNGVKYYFIEDESSRSITQVPQTIDYLRPYFK